MSADRLREDLARRLRGLKHRRSEESFDEQRARVEQMIADDGDTWDLSDNDKAALRAVLARVPADDGSFSRGIADEAGLRRMEFVIDLINAIGDSGKHAAIDALMREWDWLT